MAAAFEKMLWKHQEFIMSVAEVHVEDISVQAEVPLCVDLDGTLSYTDFLMESIAILVKKYPLKIFFLIFWLFKGKAYFKDQIASLVVPNVALMPYHREFLEYLGKEHKKGRKIYLCTASNYRIARQVIAHFGFFSGEISSDATHNLSGSNKAHALVERFGAQGFDYCGNSLTDVPVWKEAREAIVVGTQKVVAAAQRVGTVSKAFVVKPALAKLIVKEMRVYQWVKNLLIFIPLLASHRFLEGGALIGEIYAFSSFSFCASAVYLVNDLLDLEADRKHARKRNRPFASGKLPLQMGLVLTVILLAAGLLLAIKISPKFLQVLLGYLVVTTAYSFWLKRVVLIDVFTLAALYTSRILAGGAAEHIPLSYWMILFSVLIFLSLAIVKRYAELDKTLKANKKGAEGRGYHVADMAIMQTLGVASGYGAILVLALYMNTPDIVLHYKHKPYLWVMFVLLLYWISNMWLVTFRGEMHDDPIVYAAKSKLSLTVLFLCVVTVFIAS